MADLLKTCPINNDKKCNTECAWWHVKNKICAVYMIADRLEHLAHQPDKHPAFKRHH